MRARGDGSSRQARPAFLVFCTKSRSGLASDSGWCGSVERLGSQAPRSLGGAAHLMLLLLYTVGDILSRNSKRSSLPIVSTII